MDIEKLKKIRDQLNKLIQTEEPKSNFTISINDGHVEWKYPLYISDCYSIDEVYSGICLYFNARKCLPEEIYKE